MTKFLLKNMGNSEIRKRKRRQLHDKYDHDNHVYGTGSAHYTRAYIETGHKESFLPFFPSLLHSPILHLPFVSPFLFAHFHFYARHYSLSLLFSTLYLIPIFPLFLHLFRSSIVARTPSLSLSLAFPRSFILVSLSIVSTVLYTVSVPCLAFSFHSLTPIPLPSPATFPLARSHTFPLFDLVHW